MCSTTYTKATRVEHKLHNSKLLPVRTVTFKHQNCKDDVANRAIIGVYLKGYRARTFKHLYR